MFEWFNKLFEKRNVSGAFIEQLRRNDNTASYLNISREGLFSVAAVYRGVKLISEKVASAPLHLFRRIDNNGRDFDRQHPVYDLLRYQSSPQLSAFETLRTWISNTIWAGNGYLWIERIDGVPVALYNLDPRNMTPTITYQKTDYGVKPTLSYVYQSEASTIPMLADDVLHLKSLCGSDNINGMPLIDVAKSSLGLAIQQQNYAQAYYRNGSAMNLVVEVEKPFPNEEKRKEFRKALEDIHSGSVNSQRPLLIDGGTKAYTLGFSAKDASIIEMHGASIVDASNWLMLPPSKVGALVNVSYGSLEADELSVTSDCYGLWMTNIEQCIRSKLLTSAELGSHFIEFDRDALHVIDAKTRNDIDVANYINGRESWQEQRARDNRPTIKQPGEEYHRTSNVVVEGKENGSTGNQNAANGNPNQ